MAYEDNEITFPDSLPRYVDEFADRFERDYTGPCDQYRVTAHLAVGHGLTVFYAHVEDADEHFLLPFGDEDSDPAEIDRLESVVQGFASPNATDVAEAFQSHLQSTYDELQTVEGSVLFLPCQYAPVFGGRPTLVLQAYANPLSESLSVGFTPRHTEEVEDLEACISKNVPKDTVADYIDQLVYRIDTAIYEEQVDQKVVEGISRSTLEALGFRQQTTKPVPEPLHPEYGDVEAELWQVPASKATWADGSTGFVRIWRLPDDIGIIDPVNLDGPHDEEVAATRLQLTS